MQVNNTYTSSAADPQKQILKRRIHQSWYYSSSIAPSSSWPESLMSFVRCCITSGQNKLGSRASRVGESQTDAYTPSRSLYSLFFYVWRGYCHWHSPLTTRIVGEKQNKRIHIIKDRVGKKWGSALVRGHSSRTPSHATPASFFVVPLY